MNGRDPWEMDPPFVPEPFEVYFDTEYLYEQIESNPQNYYIPSQHAKPVSSYPMTSPGQWKDVTEESEDQISVADSFEYECLSRASIHQ